MYRPGELLEATPGLIVSQHSGEGKANQFYLRGFNLDHGTDLRTTVDGMPVNQRSHAHGQGWTDLNFLIPELAARLDYKQGPVLGARRRLRLGRQRRRSPTPTGWRSGIASVTLGQDGYARTRAGRLARSWQAATCCTRWNCCTTTARSRSPTTTARSTRVLRYSRGYANNGFSVTAMAYRGKLERDRPDAAARGRRRRAGPLRRDRPERRRQGAALQPVGRLAPHRPPTRRRRSAPT